MAVNGHTEPAAYETNEYTAFDFHLSSGDDLEVDLNVSLFDSEDSVSVFRQFLIDERAAAEYWTRAVIVLWKRGNISDVFTFGQAGVDALSDRGLEPSTIPLICLLANFKLKLARNAPRTILDHPLQDILLPTERILRAEHLMAAAAYLKQAQYISQTHPVVLETEIALYMARGESDSAAAVVKKLLDVEEKNNVARCAQARIHLIKRQYQLALTSFQKLLRSSPKFLPDPRIGLGLCLWNLGHYQSAEKAWQRSMSVNPGIESSGAALLLAISYLNAGKRIDATGDRKPEETYVQGIKLVSEVFKQSQKYHAMAAAVLASHMTITGDYKTATKLAERAIQLSDNKLVAAEGAYKLARALHAQGDLSNALTQYAIAFKERTDLLPAKIAHAYLLMAKGSLPEATSALISITEKIPNCIEAQVGLAAIYSQAAFSAHTSSDAAVEADKARTRYDDVLASLASIAPSANTRVAPAMRKRIQTVAQDSELYIEVGRLYATVFDPPGQGKAFKAYSEALEMREFVGKPAHPHVLNNLGCLTFHREKYEDAQKLFQTALSSTAEFGEDLDAGLMTLSFNLARVFEAQGEIEKAVDFYQKMLQRHPEWVEAKARLALIHLSKREYEQADAMLKEGLTSMPKSPEMRSLYLYYLLETRQDKVARDFAASTLREHNAHDAYANSALGMLLYSQAREIRPSNAEQAKEKANKHIQSAEFFTRVLKYDKESAFAAQGIAITLAENSMHTMAANSLDHSTRSKALREALNILLKVREVVNDASIYINLGHIYANREDWPKAIESYTAAKARYTNPNLQCQLYLARAYFHKANKDLDYNAITSSLEAAKQGLEMQPGDNSIRFNIAIIQHKALEILSSLAAERKTLAQISDALEQGIQANETFKDLSEQRSGNTSYPIEMAEQRVRYGANLVTRVSGDVRSAQAAYEETEDAKLRQAKATRDAERSQQKLLEDARLAEIQQRNEALAQQRRDMQEEASQWYNRDTYEDEEAKRNRKGKARKPKEAADFVVADGEEGAVQPKRPAKRKSNAKSKKAKGESSNGGEPAIKEDSEEDDMPAPPNKRAKAYKSAEFVESDEE